MDGLLNLLYDKERNASAMSYIVKVKEWRLVIGLMNWKADMANSPLLDGEDN